MYSFLYTHCTTLDERKNLHCAIIHRIIAHQIIIFPNNLLNFWSRCWLVFAVRSVVWSGEIPGIIHVSLRILIFLWTLGRILTYFDISVNTLFWFALFFFPPCRC